MQSPLNFRLLFLLAGCSYISIAVGARQFPPDLSNTNEISVASIPTASSPNKTPEYVIIRANEETTFSSETTGKVIYLPIKEGSNFKKGDVLLKMDCRLQQADLNKAKAQQNATSKALLAARKLKGYGMISEFEYVKTASESDAANADVDKLKAIAEKCTVIAPFTGGVSEIKIHLYETIKPGDVLLKATNIRDLYVEVQVPSIWLSWLHVGSDFNIFVNDVQKTIAAKVNLINPQIEPISQTVKITALVSPPDETLRPGMTGQAIFPDNPDNAGGSRSSTKN